MKKTITVFVVENDPNHPPFFVGKRTKFLPWNVFREAKQVEISRTMAKKIILEKKLRKYIAREASIILYGCSAY